MVSVSVWPPVFRLRENMGKEAEANDQGLLGYGVRMNGHSCIVPWLVKKNILRP